MVLQAFYFMVLIVLHYLWFAKLDVAASANHLHDMAAVLCPFPRKNSSDVDWNASYPEEFIELKWPLQFS